MASWLGLLEHLKNIPGRTLLLYSLWDLLSYPSMKLRLEFSLLASLFLVSTTCIRKKVLKVTQDPR
jgi:hypothetical protein